MAITLEVATLDGLSPELAGLYQQHPDGKFRLDLEAADGDALQRALKAERELRQSVERKSKANERRLSTIIQDGAEAIAAAQAERDAAVRAAAALRAKMLDAAVTTAAAAAGVHDVAIPDAMRAAREAFVVNDDGAIVARGEGGRFENVTEWLGSLRETSPHYFPATASGTGAPTNRSRSSGAGGNTMSRAAFEQLSPAQRRENLALGLTVTD